MCIIPTGCNKIDGLFASLTRDSASKLSTDNMFPVMPFSHSSSASVLLSLLTKVIGHQIWQFTEFGIIIPANVP